MIQEGFHLGKNSRPVLKEISAVLLSIGEKTLPRALASLQAQTLAVKEVVLVEHVSPFSRAMNQAAGQVRTPFFLQVDADMVLDPHCLQSLFEGMSEDCALTIGHLRDPIMGTVVGVKLFRTQVLRDTPFPQTVSSDVDWLQQVTRAGWKHRYVTDESQQPCPTLGSHEPAYEDNYTFCKYARWAASHLSDQDATGARWMVRTLLSSHHPSRWWALFGFTEGLARPTQRDTLVPYQQHPKVEGLRTCLQSLNWSEIPAPQVETEWQAHQLGYALGRSRRACLWSGPQAWAGAIGVALGLMDEAFGESSTSQFPWSLLQPPLPPAPPAPRPSWLEAHWPRLYPRLVRGLGSVHRCRLHSRPIPTRRLSRIAYFLWQAPGESCVQREIQALRSRGVEVLLFAQEGSPQPGVEVFPPQGPTRDWLLESFRSKPRVTLEGLRLLLSCTYTAEKTWELDQLMLRQATWLASRARRLGIQVLHSPWAHPCALIALLAARLAGIACSTEVRAHEINRVLAPDLIPVLLARMDGVVSNSHFHDQALARICPDSVRRFRRISNGLPLDSLPPPKHNLDEVCPQPLRILSVARLVDPKGLDTLLRACALLKARGIPIQCNLAGGTEEPVFTSSWIQLRRLWSRLQLQDQVHFLGDLPQARVNQLYQQHHLLALPAQVAFDGSHDVDPSCILEAMPMGLPVLTTAMGAIPEQVEHDRSGWMVPPAQPRALADALQRLWQDPGLRRRLAEQAHQRCRQFFDSRLLSGQWFDFFQSLGGAHV